MRVFQGLGSDWRGGIILMWIVAIMGGLGYLSGYLAEIYSRPLQTLRSRASPPPSAPPQQSQAPREGGLPAAPPQQSKTPPSSPAQQRQAPREGGLPAVPPQRSGPPPSASPQQSQAPREGGLPAAPPQRSEAPPSASLIRSSASHARNLFERAASAAQKGKAVYGRISSPLLGFLTPKAGTNTVASYLDTALAAIGQLRSEGCYPPDRYSCMTTQDQIARTSCLSAFATHFRPERLVDVLREAERSPDSECRRWPDRSLPEGAAVYKDVLRRSVCVTMVRDPIDRMIAAYYEWSYQKRSNLTAIEYLNLHGAEEYMKFHPGSDQEQFATPEALESCLVGVTERMEEFVTILSRALRVPQPVGKAAKLRSHMKTGLTEVDVQQFYKVFTPLLGDAFDHWRLAGNISKAQYNIALSFAPLVEQSLSNSTNACSGCIIPCENFRTSKAPSQMLTWKICRAPNGIIGHAKPKQGQGCCRAKH